MSVCFCYRKVFCLFSFLHVFFSRTLQTLQALGFTLYASIGTADFYSEHGIQVHAIDWPYEEKPSGDFKAQPVENIHDCIRENKFDLVINVPLRTAMSRRGNGQSTQVGTPLKILLCFALRSCGSVDNEANYRSRGRGF